jgi:D-alanyl-D-alanine carboxypeptidase/D-alanyl-D-alanine-endopeptidase (penicillin-binding protein 4)
MRVVSWLLAFAVAAQAAQPLAKRVASIISRSPEAQQAFFGMRVIDLQTGAVVYSLNENRFFVPASNTKLFTTALALMRLGPDYRFHTTVIADKEPSTDGSVGELRLVGGGDPNLSARYLPYRDKEFGPNPLTAIERLADQVWSSGIRLVDGEIVGDDSAYVHEPFPDGWGLDDPVWEYGAPVSALTLNDNAFTVRVEPGPDEGSPGVLTLQPRLEYLTIHNRTRTVQGGETKLEFQRLPGTRELTVSGTIPVGGKARESILAVDEPAYFAAHAFREALLERGIVVRGGVSTVHLETVRPVNVKPGVEIARHTSRPLSDAVKVINKVSQNLHTELLLLEVARAKHGIGTRKLGLEEMAAFLQEIGITNRQYNFEDGSGLSRLSLVTPLSVSKLLRYMDGTPHRDVWIDSLPVGGFDGTLDERFKKSRAAMNIRAKTGSISHVSALSGYALRPDGRRYAFAFLANNYNSPHKPIRAVLDRIALALLE